MRLFKILLCSLLLNTVFVSTVLAQDDCPAGHIRHPAVSPLDHDYMVAAFKASFRGLFGRDPSMVPGSGKDDGEYYIGASNHYGVYGDDQCHAGWSGYWESWLAVGHGDLALVQTPARFLPSAPTPTPTPVPVPTPTPPPIPSYPTCDLSTLTVKLDTIQQRVETILIEDRDFHERVKSAWDAYGKPFLKYVSPALIAFLTGRQLAK